MSALQKLKAYFGMVPTDEMDEYEDDYSGYGTAYQPDSTPDLDTYSDRVGARRRPLGTPRPVSRLDPGNDYGNDYEDRLGRRPWASVSEPPHRPSTVAPPVRGALAVDPQPEPQPRPRPTPPPQPEPAPHPLSRITTLHPRSYMEARTIGERYRDGNPVIMNLTGMADADAKRLVDFAAGLAFAMRGAMDKVTNKVFLISPPDIDVTEADRRRIAEGGFFG
ncbi:MAG TPA: cell division protein SepF [Pseudonocardiaceae bacterium]|jgi:cell division inhibitor SepF|nr:cell division protein SepF [Pseudonocardiaceae bacterium]